VRWTKPARRPVSYVVTPQRGASDVVGEIEVGSRDSPIKCLDIAICGGGPAGLLSAIMMAQRFPLRKTVVFDRLSRPPSPDDNAFWDDVARFYLIGIGGRGQNALKRFGVWDEVAKRGVPILGRKGASRLTLR
jgi:kynurenine 3-monooxygenase